MKGIIKIVKFLQDTSLSPEGVSETIQNEAKEQRRGFLSILLGTLGASLLGNNLTGKRAIVKSGIEETKSKKQGWEINRAGEGHVQGIVCTGYGCNSQSKKNNLPVHPLTNIQIKRYYQNEPRFINVYSRDNLPNKIKDGAYVINLDEYSDIGTPWIA